MPACVVSRHRSPPSCWLARPHRCKAGRPRSQQARRCGLRHQSTVFLHLRTPTASCGPGYSRLPYCEATAHITAHEAESVFELATEKLTIALSESYRERFGEEPTFAWHTVAAASESDVYIVLDPYYRSAPQPLGDYLQQYVTEDCPNRQDPFEGCEIMELADAPADLFSIEERDCVVIVSSRYVYDFIGCGREQVADSWDPRALNRAYTWLRSKDSDAVFYDQRPDLKGRS